jgi:hypothetical protein
VPMQLAAACGEGAVARYDMRRLNAGKADRCHSSIYYTIDYAKFVHGGFHGDLCGRGMFRISFRVSLFLHRNVCYPLFFETPAPNHGHNQSPRGVPRTAAPGPKHCGPCGQLQPGQAFSRGLTYGQVQHIRSRMAATSSCTWTAKVPRRSRGPQPFVLVQPWTVIAL